MLGFTATGVIQFKRDTDLDGTPFVVYSQVIPQDDRRPIVQDYYLPANPAPEKTDAVQLLAEFEDALASAKVVEVVGRLNQQNGSLYKLKATMVREPKTSSRRSFKPGPKASQEEAA